MAGTRALLARLIKDAGSVEAYARQAQVSRQTVKTWQHRGIIPAERVSKLVRALRGAVTARDLRPDLAECFEKERA